MPFYTERDEQIDIEVLETVEQAQARTYISPEATVLELGARYGTVTCAICKKLTDQRRCVAVEPDIRVWDALDRNLAINGVSCNIIKGVISRKPIALMYDPGWGGYGTTSVLCNIEHNAVPKLIHYTLEQVEEKYGLHFDTLVADCEGFLGEFMDENPHLYDQLKMIIFEKDYPQKCDYGAIIRKLEEHGFKSVVEGFHEVWAK